MFFKKYFSKSLITLFSILLLSQCFSISAFTVRKIQVHNKAILKGRGNYFVKYENLIATSNSRIGVSAGSLSTPQPKSTELLSFAKLAFRCTWLSWWAQIILTVISSVILTFANTVRQSGSNQSFWMSGFAFSTIGVLFSYLSCFLTWSNSRILKRVSAETDKSKLYASLFKAFKTSIWTSMFGMLITLLGAEQIVGTLASKVLSLQGIQPVLGSFGQQNTLQALDIFLVQANTNTLLALFAPIFCYLGLQQVFPAPPQNKTVSSVVAAVE